MTRGYVGHPIWTWFCDECGASSGDYARDQSRLPSKELMRIRGWYVARTYGDRCDKCTGNTVDKRTKDLFPSRFWFNKFRLRTKPVWFGDDEWGRKTLVIGIPGVISLVVALGVLPLMEGCNYCEHPGCPYHGDNGQYCPTHDPEQIRFITGDHYGEE